MRKNKHDDIMIDLSRRALVQRIGSEDEPEDEVWSETLTEEEEAESAPCTNWSRAAKLSASVGLILINLYLIVLTVMTFGIMMDREDGWIFWLCVGLVALTIFCLVGTGYALQTIWRE